MRKFSLGLLAGLALAMGGWWFFSDGGRRNSVDGLQDTITDQTRKAAKTVGEKVDAGVAELQDGLDQAGTAIQQEVSDATLLATLKTRLLREQQVIGFGVNVDVEAGRVRLHGTIPSEEARVLAIKLARETAGVKGLRSELVLKRPATP